MIMRSKNKSRLDEDYASVKFFEDLPLFASLSTKSGDRSESLLEEDCDSDALSALDHQILDILRDRSREQAMLGPALCRSVGIVPTPNGQRRLRTIVARLVDLGYPLGTARTGEHRGFYWLIKPEDRRTAAAHLRHQAFKILRRADRLEKSSAAAEHRGQLRLAG